MPSVRTAAARRRLALTLATAFAVAALAGCADDEPASPTASPTPSATATPAASPTPTASPATPDGADTTDGDAVTLDASCRLAPDEPDRAAAVELAYPEGWDQGADQNQPCRWFDPDPVTLPEAGEAREVAVRWHVDPVAYADAAEPGGALDVDQRLPTVVDEHRAVRLSGTATGDAGRPEGMRVVTWLIDAAGLGADADPATLIATADPDHPQAVTVLDRMVRAADIAPDQSAAGGTTVARRAGGGTPFAVNHDPERDCLELFAGARQGEQVAETCELGTPDPLTAVRLTAEPHDLAVGVTTTDVDVVRLRTNADTTRAVATVPIDDDRRAYALPLSGTEPEVIAETFDGEELGRRRPTAAGE